jgi:ribose 5-phosphate isomerase RpiB
MAAAHNNFNIACFWWRFWLFDNYREYIDILVNTEFEWQRHERRTNKLNSKYMNSI